MEPGRAERGRLWRGLDAARPVASILSIREGRVGTVLLAGMVIVIVAGPWMAPYSPTETGVGPPLAGPSVDHPLGTDALGRDVLSRVLCGGRDVAWLPFVGIVLAFAVGGGFAVIAGYRRGGFDALFARCVDLMLSIPAILLVLLIIAGAGKSSGVLIVGVAIVFAPRIARIMRGAAQVMASSEFVDSARVRGERAWTIAVHELAPNLTGVAGVEFALRFTQAIVFVATLNFLGLGAQPPSSTWGLMAAEGRSVMSQAPLVSLAPVFCIAVLAIAVNLLADAGARRMAGSDSLSGAKV